MSKIIFRPIVTEKMTALAGKNQYAFDVDGRANKLEVQKAVEKIFNVKVESVRTTNIKGKAKSQMTRKGAFSGRTSNWKKAYVTLRAGDKIDFFEHV
jgi:large subunit ribosomal protein L23